MLNMIESRVHGAHLAAVGAADHLRAPPVADRFRRASGCRRSPSRSASTRRSSMSREVNMIGMAIAKGLEEHGQVGATHMGTAFDAWYPGYVDYAPNFKNIAGVLDRDRALPVRDAARVHDRRLPAEHARPAPAEPVFEPVAARAVAPARRGRLHGNGVAVGARVRVEVQGLAAVQPVSGRTRSDRAAAGRRRRTRTSFRRISAIRSRPSRCSAVWRSAACASRS